MTSTAATKALMFYLENGDGPSTDVWFTSAEDLAESTSTTIGTSTPRQFKGDRPFMLNGHPATVAVNGWAHPSIAAATLVTNCIVCVVLMRREMRSPTNALLIGMAVSDTLTAVLPLPCFIRFYTLSGYRDWVPYNWCFVWFLLTDYLPTITHTTSIWLTVALAFYRYLVVVRSRVGPRTMSARLRRTTSWKSGSLRSTFIIIVLVYVASFAIHCCRFFEYKYQAVPVLSRLRPLPPSSTAAAVYSMRGANNDTVQSSTSVNGSGNGALFSSRHHQLPVVVGCRYDLIPFISQHADVYYATYYWTRIVVVHVVPCVSLVILNAALVRTMIVAEQRRRQLTRRRSTCVTGSTNSDVMSTAIFSTMGVAMAPRRRRRLSEGNATTLMLVAVVGLLLIVEVPLALLLAIVLIENTFQILIISVRSTSLSTIVINFLVLLSYPLNFFVYCAMSQKFREAFWRMFGVNASQRLLGNHVTLRCCRRIPDETSPDAAGTCRSTPV